MDDTANVVDLLEELGDNIDDLETALEPLLKTPISTLSKNLAPLEKAKLLTWLTYAIETILFSHIRLNGTEDPKSHPVMTELKRIQQYMQKVQQAENPAAGKRENLSLNKEAAGRFIKAGLAGNDKYDQQVAERKAREAEGARRKLQQLELASPSSAVPSFGQVVPGAGVSIILKKDQKSGDQVQGIVKEALTQQSHSRGVKVRLQDGRVGRVQAIVDVALARMASEGLQNLGRNGEPKKKRKADDVEDEEDVDSSDVDEGDAMEVDQQEGKKKAKKAKHDPEKKRKKMEKKSKKNKEGG
jgi:uncharacterized repeat protein (TIGR03833 family)